MMLFSMCELISIFPDFLERMYNLPNYAKVFIFVLMVVAEVAKTPATNLEPGGPSPILSLLSPSTCLPLGPMFPDHTPPWLAVSPWPAWGKNPGGPNTHLFEESDDILTDLGEADNDIVHEDVVEGGMVSALPPGLVQD